MPSVTKGRLEALESSHAEAAMLRGQIAVLKGIEADRNRVEDELTVARASIAQFDEVLDKVFRCSLGAAIVSPRTDSYARQGIDPGYGMSRFDNGIPSDRMTDEEKRDAELRELRQQVISSAELLAGVRAICQFAKEHKA